jgi:hypothetical protein
MKTFGLLVAATVVVAGCSPSKSERFAVGDCYIETSTSQERPRAGSTFKVQAKADDLYVLVRLGHLVKLDEANSQWLGPSEPFNLTEKQYRDAERSGMRFAKTPCPPEPRAR